MEPTGAKMLDAKGGKCPGQDPDPQAPGGPNCAVLRGSIPLAEPWFHCAAQGHIPYANCINQPLGNEIGRFTPVLAMSGDTGSTRVRQRLRDVGSGRPGFLRPCYCLEVG